MWSEMGADDHIRSNQGAGPGFCPDLRSLFGFHYRIDKARQSPNWAHLQSGPICRILWMATALRWGPMGGGRLKAQRVHPGSHQVGTLRCFVASLLVRLAWRRHPGLLAPRALGPPCSPRATAGTRTDASAFQGQGARTFSKRPDAPVRQAAPITASLFRRLTVVSSMEETLASPRSDYGIHDTSTTDVNNDGPKRQLSVKEAGRRGGKATAEKYGHEFYQEIGRKGGATRATAEDVRNGDMGRMGAEARWGREVEIQRSVAAPTSRRIDPEQSDQLADTHA